MASSRILKKTMQSWSRQSSSEMETARVGRCDWQVVEGFHMCLFPAQWKEHVDE